MSAAGRVRYVAVGDLAQDAGTYFETVGADSCVFIKCRDCGGTGSFETGGWTGPVHVQRCENCDGTGQVRDVRCAGLS